VYAKTYADLERSCTLARDKPERRRLVWVLSFKAAKACGLKPVKLEKN
jgi:hypothetical protein